MNQQTHTNRSRAVNTASTVLLARVILAVSATVARAQEASAQKARKAAAGRMLVEARQTNGGREWQYAFARMNSVQFIAKYRNRQVWSVEIWPWSRTKNGIEPYTQFGPFNRPTAVR